MNKIKGIIFDMDGVISDTQKLHSKVECEILNRHGLGITPEEITKKYSGVRTKEFFDDLLKQQDSEYDLDLLMEEKWAKMKSYAETSVDSIEGSVELIKRLSEKYPLTVASASNLDYVETVLKTLGVFEYFDYVVSGDMVSKGKPDPESFLLAASKIDIAPENCLVFEDGISGMQAAKDSGMHCIGLVADKNDAFPTANLVDTISEITDDYINTISNNN